MGTNGKKIAYLFLIITTSAWESLYVAGKFVLKSIPPITVLFFRYLIASILGAYIIISRVGGCGAILGAVLIVMSILFSIFLVIALGYFLRKIELIAKFMFGDKNIATTALLLPVAIPTYNFLAVVLLTTFLSMFTIFIGIYLLKILGLI